MIALTAGFEPKAGTPAAGAAADPAQSEGADQVTADEPFFREWRSRRPGERRSIERAGLLAAALGVAEPRSPVLTVVGSKGKGTAATFASAWLVAAGRRVCTVTSPGLRGSRDRIRVDGRALTEDELRSLAGRLRRAMRTLPERTDGYLSPVGLFTLAGILHARSVGADVLVLEAGMGGRSDEVGLFTPTVAVITPVFAEHVGVLGDTPVAIAEDKAAVVAPGTRAVVSCPQPAEIAEAVARTVADRTEGAVEVEVADGSGGLVRAGLLPQGLGRAAAEAGCTAAHRLLQVRGWPEPPAGRLRAVLSSVSLPGRLSRHRVPGSSAEILVDSAIDRAGVATALAAAQARWGAVDHVLVCLPDHKDLDGAITELGDHPVTFVRLPYPHLRFTRPLPGHWRVVEAGDLDRDGLAALGDRLVALGTVYFTGRILDLVEADTERLFTPPS
jgi:dihydrofolate synthase/folylpolyglutamate synthase